MFLSEQIYQKALNSTETEVLLFCKDEIIKKTKELPFPSNEETLKIMKHISACYNEAVRMLEKDGNPSSLRKDELKNLLEWIFSKNGVKITI